MQRTTQQLSMSPSSAAGPSASPIAWRAAARGMRALVLERDRRAPGTSRHAAGMLAPVAEVGARRGAAARARPGQRRAVSRVRGRAEHDSGMTVGYTRCGTLLVARDADEAEALERELALRDALRPRVRAAARRARRAASSPRWRRRCAWRWTSPATMRSTLGPLVSALAAASARRGGELRSGAAVGVDRRRRRAARRRWSARRRLAGPRPARWSIAAGAWSASLDGVPPGARVPLRPVKGQILRLHDPDGPGLLTRVIRMGAVLHRAARRRPLRDRRDLRGARLRHDGHRRRGVRAAA